MALLKGASPAVIEENIRTLVGQGLSETEATVRATRHAKGSDDEEPRDSPVAEGGSSARHFVIVTKDFSGLGWARRLLQEGERVTVATDFNEEEDPKLRTMMQQVGEGWVTVLPLAQAVKTLQTPSTYWIFSENNFPKIADDLRKKKQKVFGTSGLTDRLEHDRQFAVDRAREAGLESPSTHSFTQLDEGLAFLEAHPDTAYVFKPDDGQFNYMTFVPSRREDQDAHEELVSYLTHMKQDPGDYLLQERIPLKDALEVNAEVWLFEGEPFMATVGLEIKRKNAGDLGEMAGCGGDLVQIIPLDCRLVQETIGKLLPFYQKERYTGFADVNVIYTPDGTPYFLEVCNRFGYNAHVTMLLGLLSTPLGDLLADFVDGKVESIPDRFDSGLGASLTLFVDHPREGLPVHVDPGVAAQFFPFDGWEEDGRLLLTGYSDEIGIVVAKGASTDVAAAAVTALLDQERVSVPDGYYRQDLGSLIYPNAPILRYRALKKRGLL